MPKKMKSASKSKNAERKIETAWECSCGYVEHGEEAPEECPKCFKLDEFIKLSGELARDRNRVLEGEE